MAKIKHLENKFSIASYELIIACKPLELKFYLWLKLWAINKHSAWPSYATITKELDISTATLSNLLKDMEQLRRLKIERTNGKNSIYDITWYDELTGKTAFVEAEELAPNLMQGTLETKGESTLETKVGHIYITNRNINDSVSNETVPFKSPKEKLPKEIQDKVITHYKKEYFELTGRTPPINYPATTNLIKSALKVITLDEILDLISRFRNSRKASDFAFDINIALTPATIILYQNGKF